MKRVSQLKCPEIVIRAIDGGCFCLKRSGPPPTISLVRHQVLAAQRSSDVVLCYMLVLCPKLPLVICKMAEDVIYKPCLFH